MTKLRESMITLYQLCVGMTPTPAFGSSEKHAGEAWHEIMNAHFAESLDPGVFIAFILFYFIIGILFAQLIAGIIVNLYLRSQWHKDAGEVLYTLPIGAVLTYAYRYFFH